MPADIPTAEADDKLPVVVASMPTSVGVITFLVGFLLAIFPRAFASLLGLEGRGQEAAIRMVGLSDLALAPGLVSARPRWQWMLARSALNLMDAAYLQGVASQSERPERVRAGVKAMLALTVVDGVSGILLKRARR